MTCTAPTLRPASSGIAEELTEATHAPAYVEALRTGEPYDLAGSQGFSWDEGIWDMAVNSTAGVLAAADEALATGGSSGSLSSGLHHARHARGGLTDWGYLPGH